MAGLVPRYVSIVEAQPLSQGALVVKYAIEQAMSELGQHLLSLLTGFYVERQEHLGVEGPYKPGCHYHAST